MLRTQAETVWANRLRAHMDALGISTQDLAEAADTTYQTIWKILRGELYPRESLRISIALALGADLDRLFPMPTAAQLAAAVKSVAAA